MELYFSKRVAVILVLIVGIGVFLLGSLTSNLTQEVVQLTEDRLVPIYKVDTEEQKLAITLDGMWGAEHTPHLLEIFAEHEVTITFFFGGNWLEDYPEMAKKIAAEGHEIGNHTYSHPHLNSLSRDEIAEELEYNQELIEDLVGEQPKLFRPPFGEYSNKVIEVAEDLGFQTIQWSIDSLDWKEPGVDFIVERLLEKSEAGDIILMHNNAPHTPEALERVIPKLQERGYELVKLSELTYDEDYYIESHSGLQKKLGN
ncbi:polysaccharide deacetylase family protein [Fuchsiella alkaliacetigena]|uniref:polysaccharide deacetylase family protein n=1 Tax=Fuchsiella alkaliacetigena TaxID=957042 RepID=UPI00200B5D27|nr:polysaccharide deacetylase family protein [Fuchsiella alkaliacetigena]MCK8823493.1 polysaccharide deacetylase family protein [Fuchsiella alkaliacetigena]